MKAVDLPGAMQSQQEDRCRARQVSGRELPAGGGPRIGRSCLGGAASEPLLLPLKTC